MIICCFKNAATSKRIWISPTTNNLTCLCPSPCWLLDPPLGFSPQGPPPPPPWIRPCVSSAIKSAQTFVCVIFVTYKRRTSLLCMLLCSLFGCARQIMASKDSQSYQWRIQDGAFGANPPPPPPSRNCIQDRDTLIEQSITLTKQSQCS